MRTITVTQPQLGKSALTLTEAGAEIGSYRPDGLFKRSASLVQPGQVTNLIPQGLLGRKVLAVSNGATLAQFNQTGLLGRGNAQVRGVTYRLKTIGVFNPQYVWVAPDGTEAIKFKLKSLLRTSGSIEIAESINPIDLPALLGFGLFVRAAAENNTADAAGAGG